jgi:hypothetical protein
MKYYIDTLQMLLTLDNFYPKMFELIYNSDAIIESACTSIDFIP